MPDAGAAPTGGSRGRSGGPAALLARLAEVSGGIRRHVVVVGALSAARAAATLAAGVALAWLLAGLFDGTTGVGPAAGAARVGSTAAVAVFVAAVAVRAAADGLLELAGTRAGDRVRSDLRRHVLATAAADPLALAGDAESPAAAAGPGLDAVDTYLRQVLPAMVAAGVAIPATLAVVAWADPLSALLLALCLPLTVVLLALVGSSTARVAGAARDAAVAHTARLLDLLAGLATLKVLGRDAAALRAHARQGARVRADTGRALRWAALSGLVLDLSATLSVAVVAVDAGLRLRAGDLALRPALVVLILAAEVFLPLRTVGARHHAAVDGRLALAAVLDLTAPTAGADTPTAGADADADAPSTVAAAAPDAGYAVQLTAVTAGYPGGGGPVLRGADLTVRVGELVTVRGASGGGKSTLAAVLTGALAAGSGRVRCGAVVWCPQRPQLTQATAGDEARLGDPAATRAEVAAALAACGAPRAATALDPDGTGVSAGQRRRVAVARTLLRARAVRRAGRVALVVLDEPSEDLDGVAEQRVVDVVRELRAAAGVLVVSHSPALATAADRCLTLVDGVLHPDRPADLGEEPAADPHPDVVRDRAVAPGGPEGTAPDRPGETDPVPVRRAVPDGDEDAAAIDTTVAHALRRLVVRAVGLGTLAALATVGTTGSSAWLVLRAGQHPDLSVLGLAVVAVRAGAILRCVARYGERLAGHQVSLLLAERSRTRTLAALVPLVPAGLARWGRGDLLHRLSSDADADADAVGRGLLPAAGAVVTVVAVTGAVALVSPVAAGLLAVLLVTAVAAGLVAARDRTAGGAGHRAAVADGEARRDAVVVSMARAGVELSVLGALPAELDRLAATDRALARAARSRRRLEAAGTTVAGLLTGIAPVAVLAALLGRGAVGAHGPVLVGVLALVIVPAAEAAATLSGLLPVLADARARRRSLAALLATAPPVPVPAVPTRVPAGPLAVDARRLGVDRAGRRVAGPVDLATGSAGITALVGPSGGGKSSVLAAATRLLPAVAGSVALAGRTDRVDLGGLDPAGVTAAVGVLLQDEHLFRVSLRDNLRLGAPAATDADLDGIADALGLLPWVRRLPAGWDTVVGSDGARVSGGQHRRLALARVLLGSHRLLVLDEPTAHLDPATERRVLAAVAGRARRAHGCAVLLATHSTVAAAAADHVVRVGDPLPALTVAAGRTPRATGRGSDEAGRGPVATGRGPGGAAQTRTVRVPSRPAVAAVATTTAVALTPSRASFEERSAGRADTGQRCPIPWTS